MLFAASALCFGLTCCSEDDYERPIPFQTDGRDDSHEWIDLDLPSGTLWATCNIGASSSEEYGDYFAWGETTPKTDYSWSTYKYSQGSGTTMIKYCTDSNYGMVDNRTELDPADDAATAIWGNNWQMPSLAQCQELCSSDYTTTTWTTRKGVYGRIITSKTNGNSIFLPAAGSRDKSGFHDVAGKGSNYWSRSLFTERSDLACGFGFYVSEVMGWGAPYRFYGSSVRPVRVKK